MRKGRPLFAVPDQMQGTETEINASFKGCISYFGSYTVDEDSNLIVHRVEGSLFPNMEGTNQIRMFEITDNQLTLKTPPMKLDGDMAFGTLHWERVN
jgi:Lipocalin-like domain